MTRNEDELELKEGDVIDVIEKCDDGWFVGKFFLVITALLQMVYTWDYSIWLNKWNVYKFTDTFWGSVGFFLFLFYKLMLLFNKDA